MKISLQQILDYLNAECIHHTVIGNPSETDFFTLASLKNVVPTGLYFVEAEYSHLFKNIYDSIVITNCSENEVVLERNNSFLLVSNPQAVFYNLCRLVEPEKEHHIHPTAVVHSNAQIGNNVNIGPYSVIGNCRIGNNCFIDSHVVIGDGVEIGNNVRIEPHSYIGANGVAWIWDDTGHRIIQPQYGGVTIEDDCFIGSDVSVVRGSVNENTFIGQGTLIAHGSKLGHGSNLGQYCHLANNVSLAGNSRIGTKCFLGSGCIVSSNVSIAPNTVVGAGAVVSKSWDEEGILLVGVPAVIVKRIGKAEKLKGVPKFSDKKR